MKTTQLELPLFAPDVMEKVKEGHRLLELEKLRKIIEHQSHVIAGHKGAWEKQRKKKEHEENRNSSGQL